MSLYPGTINFRLKRGGTFTKRLTWKQAGVAVNLTGKTARMRIKTAFGAPTVLLELTSSSGITLGGSNGTIDFLITATQSAELPVADLVYDLEIIDGSTVTKLTTGTITVTAGT